MKSLIQARIDPQLKADAACVLNEMGLSVSDAMRILLTRIAKEGRFPLELVPNALTTRTLEQSAKGEDVHSAANSRELFEQLGI